MKVVRLITLLYLLIGFNLSKLVSQSWEPVQGGFDRTVRCLFNDTSNNILYVGGGFKSVINGVNARGIASWNGNNWDSLSTGIDDFNSSFPNNVLTIFKYFNYLYIGGAFNTAGGILTPYLALWDGNSWMPAPFNVNGAIGSINNLNNNLIFSGDFTQINNLSINYFASYDLNNIAGPNLSLDSTFGTGVCVTNFLNETYYAGNLLYNGGRDLLKWDSSQVSNISNGIQGGVSWVNALAVYKNELYIGGYFTKASGNVGDFIMKWDGNILSEVGGGLNDQVFCMKVYNDELYIAGNFTLANGSIANRIVKWDGNNWKKINDAIFDNGIEDIEFYNNELYIGGGFKYIDTVLVNYIAKISLINEIKEIDFSSSITLFPLPAHDVLNIKSKYVTNGILTIKNILGKQIHEEYIESTDQINISFLNPGSYILKISTSRGIAIKIFLKE